MSYIPPGRSGISIIFDSEYIPPGRSGITIIMSDAATLFPISAFFDEDYSSYPLGPTSGFFEEIYNIGPFQSVIDEGYSIFFPQLVFLNSIYGLRLGVFLNEYYKSNPIVSQLFNGIYGDSPLLRRYVDEQYGDLRGLISYIIEEYNLNPSFQAFIDEKYSIAEEPVGAFRDLIYDLMVNNPQAALLDEIYAINASSVIEAQQLEIYLDGVRVNPYHVNFEFNRDSYKAFAEIHVADQETYLLAIENQSVLRIKDGIDDLYFEVEVPREMANPGVTSYVIPAESKSRILERTGTLNETFPAGLASELAIEIAARYGITLAWEVYDWFIPAGNLYANDEVPIEVIRKLVRAIGGKLQPTEEGNLRVVRNMEYDVTVWDTAPPTYYLTDQANFFSTSEDSQEREGFNKVFISDHGTSSAASVLEEEEISPTKKYLKGYKIPFTGEELTLFHSGGSWIGVDKHGATEETLTEVVEVIKGEANVAKPIYELVSYVYKQAVLGAITYAEDGTITTEVAEQSLVEITYKTKYWEWTVTNPREEDVQFWVE